MTLRNMWGRTPKWLVDLFFKVLMFATKILDKILAMIGRQK